MISALKDQAGIHGKLIGDVPARLPYPAFYFSQYSSPDANSFSIWISLPTLTRFPMIFPGSEAIDMLQALNTGHDGSLSTGHANSSKDMLARLETMVLMGMDLPLVTSPTIILSGRIRSDDLIKSLIVIAFAPSAFAFLVSSVWIYHLRLCEGRLHQGWI